MFENIRERWKLSSKGVRAGFLAGLLLIAAIFVGLAFWAAKDDYQVLFANLDPQDAATMVTELEKLKLAYRLQDDGKTILVNKDAVYKTRLKLMGKGVNLRGTVGFEIFNNTDFGTTEFAQKINYQRALQGELARTIMDFEEVKFARVHLVMPDSGLFKKNNAKPKASISLIMKGDTQLSPEQVAGIQRLVAASVPEIDAASVTVLDQRGVALSRSHEASEFEGTGNRFESKKQIEAYLTRKIADMLDKAVGPGQAIVSVDATLTQDHVKVTREDVLPLSTRDGESAGAVVRRRQTQQNVAQAKEADASKPSDATNDKEARREKGSGTLEVEYQNGRRVEQTVSTPGGIRRISVGVLLSDNLSSEQIEKIRDVVSMAAGINPERGDSIAINSIGQFAANAEKSRSVPPTVEHASQSDEPTAAQAQAAPTRSNAITDRLWMFLIAAVLFAAAFVVLRGARGTALKERAREELTEAERLEALEQVRKWISSDSATLTSKATT